MRLAFISTIGYCAWGGSEELWTQTSLVARAAGHDVAASVHRWHEPRPKLQRLSEAGVKVIERPELNGPMKLRKERFFIRHPNAAVKLATYISPFRGVLRPRPDVLCLSQGDSYDLVYHFEYRLLLKYLQRERIPLVLVLQLSQEDKVLPDQHQDMARDGFKYAKAIGVVAERQIKLCQYQLACALPHARVVRNPVNMPDSSLVPWPSQAEGEPLKLAVVARVATVHKGHEILLEALTAPQWKGRNWKLRIVGTGPQENYLKKLAQFLGIADRVEFCGHQSDIRAVWADNHMMILPTRMEGAPLAIVEAMLCGRPVVSTDVGGVKEWVADNETGFVAACPTATMINEALDRAWAKRDQWRAMGAAGHTRAAAMIDPNPGQTLLRILEDAARAS